MLSLSSLEVQANNKKFSRKTKKFIRFSYKNSINSSKQSSIYVNDATIKWSQPLTIPEVYDQDIDFEVYDKHEFGYNPQQLQTILYGTIKLYPQQKIGKFSVFSTAQDHKKIGSLIVDSKKIVKPVIVTSSKTISSILVRKLKQEVPKGYFVIKNNSKVIRTSLVNAISKQLLFTEQHDMGKPKGEDTIIFQLFDHHDKSLARGMIVYQDCQSSNKIDLYSTQNNEHFAELYFEVMDNLSNSNVFKASNAKIQSSPPTTLHKYRTMSESHLTKNQNYSTMFQNGQRKKRISVVHGNNDVVFPKQERFQVYQDRQTNVISYSKLATLKFYDDQSKKYYKGASIGKGSKTDFTSVYRGNPGVGNYKLPSIFDRY